MKYSYHALERLNERYNFIDEKSKKEILKMFFMKNNFKTLQVNEDGTCIRRIKYQGEEVQAIVNPLERVIISIIPPMIDTENVYIQYDNLCLRILKLKRQVRSLEKQINIKRLFQLGKYFMGKEV